MEQLINQVFIASNDESNYKIDIIQDIISLSDNNLQNFTKCRDEVTENAAILEAQAFVALLTLLRQENINNLINPGAIEDLDDADFSHQMAIIRLQESLLKIGSNQVTFIWRPNDGDPYDNLCNSWTNDDENLFKITESLMLFNRAWDLYLAIENAYEHYYDPGNPQFDFLLTSQQKSAINIFLKNTINSVSFTLTNMPLTLPIFGIFFPDIRYDKVQAGNWPYIAYAGLVYSLMNTNGASGYVPIEYGLYTYKVAFLEMFEHLRYDYSGSVENNRERYWVYQSGGGKKYWGEGPMYFRLAVNATIPFWHAMRQNDNLSNVTYFQSSIPNNLDPFRDSRFINPLIWLGNVLTPENETPAIDDGNKQFTHVTQLMNWNAMYGSQNVSTVFGRIKNKMTSRHRNYNLMELAIPQNLSEAANSDPELVISANSQSKYQSEDDLQQAVLTFRDAHDNSHYLLINGEHGEAVTSGEGHEQPDQLQLIYSINGESIIYDPGYDSAKPFKNSTWNEFYHHNVPYYSTFSTYEPIENGGYSSPAIPSNGDIDIILNIFGLFKIKIWSFAEPSEFKKETYHQPAFSYLEENNPNYSILTGYSNHIQTNGISEARIATDFRRNVIFVKDAEPYLIDINQVKNLGSILENVTPVNGIENYYHRIFRTFTTSNEIELISMKYNLPKYYGYEDLLNQTTINNFFRLGNNSISATQKSFDYNIENARPSNTGSYMPQRLSVSMGQNFSNGLIHNGAISIKTSYSNFNDIKESGSQTTSSSLVMVSENGIEFENLSNHQYTTQSLSNSREIYGKQAFVGIFKANRTTPLKDIYKYEYIDMNTKNMVTMYFIEKNSSEMDVVVTYSNNDVGNQILNLKYPTKLIDLTQFANTKKGYSFFQLLKVNGNWTYKSKFNTNVYYTSNATINTTQIEANSGVSVANNVTLTIVGSGNLNDETTISLGNNAKVKFTSGNVEFQNASFYPIYPTDNYIVESIYPSKIIIPNSSKVTIQGKPSFTGYRLQIDQGGELEIKDGTEATFSDSFQFYNYGTFRVGEGVKLNLKNQHNYAGSTTLINLSNGSQSFYNLSANGSVYFNGDATIKNTTFKKRSSSNFYQIQVTGSAERTFENVQVEGSQYGFQVSNVPDGKVSFKNLTGNANYYGTLKATNANIAIDGFTGTNSVQDGMSAYTNSNLELEGEIVASNNLLGLRSAYGSLIQQKEENYVHLNLQNNTRGIHAYNNNGAFAVRILDGIFSITDNNLPDNLYSVPNGFDLVAVNSSKIKISGQNNTGVDPVESKDATSWIDVYFINEGGGGQVRKNGDSEVVSEISIIAKRNDFFKAYRDEKEKPEFTKATRKQWISDFKSHKDRSVRSLATLLDVLDLVNEGDFSWIEQFDKKASLMPLIDEDARQLAEQVFYYYVMTKPNESEASYWKQVLDKSYPEIAETGYFDALYESANFTQKSVSEEETQVNEVNQVVSVQVSPNPFNPTTRLQFSLKTNAQVMIQVYDIMGRLVKTLANAAYEQGNHTVTFDASALASGMYFARTTIVANGKSPVVQTSKMMLIK